MRWCIDEETGSADFNDVYMDNIIKAKSNDALRWACLYAHNGLLSGGDASGADNPTIRSYKFTQTEAQSESEETIYPDGYEEGSDAPTLQNGVITLPYDFLKLIRVRVGSWFKGVMSIIQEDSDAYLQQSDATAAATRECPLVAVIEDYPNRLELYPKPECKDTVELTITVNPVEISISDMDDEDTDVAVPTKLKTAFLYYLAYLVLCAYNDTNKASLMLNIAKMGAGIGMKDE